MRLIYIYFTCFLNTFALTRGFLYNSCANKVEHYRIRSDDEGRLTIDNEEHFENLLKLIEVICPLILELKIITHACV